MSRDWDCKRDGHVPVRKAVPNSGLGKGAVVITWCAMCGKRLVKKT